MAGETRSPETVRLQRRRLLPGVDVELRTVFDSARCYWFHSPGFEFFVPITWRGEIRHPRGHDVVGPGSLLAAHPGDLYESRRVLEPGSWHALTLQADVVAALGGRAAWERIRLRPFSRLSAHLAGQFEAVVRSMRAAALDVVLADLRGFLAGAAAELAEAESPRRGVAA
jgi:hypothetical protein